MMYSFFTVLLFLPAILCLWSDDLVKRSVPDPSIADMSCFKMCLETFRTKIGQLDKNIKPMSTVLGGVTVAEAFENLDKGCADALDSVSCFETCPYGEIIKKQLEQNIPFKMICMENREEWKENVLRCEVNHRDAFVAECTRPKLEKLADIYERIQKLMQKMLEQPYLLYDVSFRGQFSEFCSVTSDILKCMSTVVNSKCPPRAHDLVQRVFIASVAGHSPEVLGQLAPECEDMAETALRIG